MSHVGKHIGVIVGMFVGLGALLLVAGMRRVTVWSLAHPTPVMSLPFGNGPMTMGRAIGLDGRIYGPLAFAVGGSGMAIADTYHGQIYYKTRRNQVIPAANMMIEDMVLSPSGALLAADNRNLSVWKLGSGAPRPIIALPQRPGYTESIWHLAAGPKGRIYVEWVRFGRGTFTVGLSAYSRTGHLIQQLARSHGGETQALHGLQGFVVNDPVRTFQVGPDGHIYIEPPNSSARRRTIRIYGAQGAFVRDLTVTSPVAIQHSELLGVSQRGWVYLGVNLSVSGQAYVIVVNEHGQTLAKLHVHAVPVYASVYGRVTPNGDLFLDQSTSLQYRIVQWHPVENKVWRWTF